MSNNFHRGLAVVGAVGGLLIAAPLFAHAGVCPVDKEGIDVRPANATPAKGVTDTVINSIDVSKEPAAIEGRLFRLRRLVIQPGGVVPWHSHGDRPAIIYVVKGVIQEYASHCSVPITHSTGDSVAETHGTSHWWKNNSKTTVVLLSADLFPVKSADPHTM